MELSFVILLFVALISYNEGSQDCGVTGSLQTDPHPEFDETANNLQAQWTTKDTIIVVGSKLSATNPTTIWLGAKRSSVDTFRFTKHNDITESVDPQSLQISPVSLSTVILLSGDKRYLYVSTNGATKWQRHSLPGIVQEFMLSSVSKARMALVTVEDKLYFSDNYGSTWQLVHSNVQRVALVNTTYNNEFIFFSIKSSMRRVFPLYRYNIHSRSLDEIDSMAFRFYVDSKYLFLSKENYTRNGASNSLTRRFYVSTNFDQSHVTFTEVQLPATKWEDYVVVMKTHETGAFIHISDSKDMQKGKLYVSDKGGSRFTLSLDNHLFQRYSILFVTMVTFDDFYEVSSIRGVYITTAVNSTDSSHYSVITFNNGGSWQRITPPTGTKCSQTTGCSLHLHISYSRVASTRLYNSTLRTGPLSTSNAPGFIIAHGSLGTSRDYDPSNAIIVTSKDGGYTWNAHSNLSGLYSYGIADYGNIIAVVPDVKYVKYLWFSHDRGKCFTSKTLDTSKYFKLSKGLLMDPAAASLYAFALGLEGSNDDDAWRLVGINFGSILGSSCHSNDYIKITEHTASNVCILGYKAQYTITKPSSTCHNDASYSPLPVSIKKCPCNFTDMECDYGFTAKPTSNGGFSCSPMNGFNLSSVCPPGQQYYYQSVSGYRLIAGDICTNTTQSQNLLKQQRKSCTGHEQNSGYTKDDGNKSKKNVAKAVIGSLFIVVAVILAAVLALYIIIQCYKKRSSFHDRVIYKKIPLTESGASSDERSSSDEDMLN